MKPRLSVAPPAQRSALHLIPKAAPRRYSPLALWHLLSLDAPSVAAVWLVFVARTFQVSVSWAAPAAMFVAVWMIYVVDRLLDARVGNHDAAVVLELRHRFHYRHRSAFLIVFAVAAIVLLWLLHRLDIGIFRTLAALSALLVAWMLAIHVRPRGAGLERLPKEAGVGVFFAAAIFLPAALSTPLSVALFLSAILFAIVCTLNCLFLFAWERQAGDASNTRNLLDKRLHFSTRWGATHLIPISCGVVLAACIASLLLRPSAIAIACAISAALLLLLHRFRARFSAVHLRATADLVLLSPLLLFTTLHR